MPFVPPSRGFASRTGSLPRISDADFDARNAMLGLLQSGRRAIGSLRDRVANASNLSSAMRKAVTGQPRKPQQHILDLRRHAARNTCEENSRSSRRKHSDSAESRTFSPEYGHVRRMQ